MTYSTSDLDEFALPLPIAQAARTTAQQFASQQPTSAKAAQVQLNTLAVWVVNDYLQLMGIATDLTMGDSWNPLVRLCADVADLNVTNIGRLECRPVQSQTQPCSIPPELWHDRIGYVVVYVDESFEEAKILGFTEVPSIAVSLNQLRSPEDLLDHLYALSQATSTQPNRQRIRLSQWLQGMVDAGWQTVEALLPTQPEFAFRGLDTTTEPTLDLGIRRVKLLPLGQSGDSLAGAQRSVAIALLLEVTSTSSETSPLNETAIRLQVHPLNQSYLPPDMTLAVLDESGAVFLEAQSRDADNYIQLEFSGQPEETFSVQVALDGDRVTDRFVI